MTRGPALEASQLPQEIRERILQAVEEGFPQLLQTAQEAVRINSINPDHDEGKLPEAKDGETKVSRFLAEYMREAGMEVDLFAAKDERYNAVGVLDGGDGPSLLFNGHVDVVAVGDPERWKVSQPFGGDIIDGKLYGRGSTDDKAPLVCAIAAVKALKDAGLRPKGKVLVEAVCGEENMDTPAGTGACIQRGYRADAGICVETSDHLAVAPASPGTLTFEIHIKGKAGHTCMRDEICRAGGGGDALAVSALDKAVYIYEGLRLLEHQWGFSKSHPAFERPGHFTINPGTFYAGPSPFAIAEEACLTYTAWYAPYENEQMVKAEIMDFISKWCAVDTWLKDNPPTYNWFICWPSYDVPVDAPICKTLQGVHAEVLGQPGRIKGFAAVADVAFLNAAGVPTVVMGPGTLGVSHGPDEYVEVEQLLNATKMYALAIASWCGVE